MGFQNVRIFCCLECSAVLLLQLYFPLRGEITTFLDKYLYLHFDSPEKAVAIKSKYSRWNLVIECFQVCQALHELMDEIPDKWDSFKWKVIVVRLNSSVDEYTQLARFRNEREKKGYIYECTIYDLLRELRHEYDKRITVFAEIYSTGLRRTKSKVTHNVFAEQYNGGEHSANTCIKQAVTVAAQINQEAIDASSGGRQFHSQIDVYEKSIRQLLPQRLNPSWQICHRRWHPQNPEYIWRPPPNSKPGGNQQSGESTERGKEIDGMAWIADDYD